MGTGWTHREFLCPGAETVRAISTWEKLLIKHRYTVNKYSVIAGRGMSVGFLGDHPVWLSNCERVILVNDWGRHRSSEALHYIPDWLLEHEKKMTCFVNHDPRYSAVEVGSGDHKRKFSQVTASGSRFKDIHRNFNGDWQHGHAIHPGLLDKVWKSTDHGIRAVMWEASQSNHVIITGIDFWETPYWPEDCKITKGIREDAQYKKWRQSTSKTHGSIHTMIDFLKACDSCVFYIHTLSPAFKAALEDLSKQVVHVKLI